MPDNRVDRTRPSAPLAFTWLLATALTLAGCAVSPIQEEADLLAPVAGEPLRQADALAAQGRAESAAEAYLDIAKGAKTPARGQLQLKAARVYLEAGETQRAQQVVARVSRPGLTPGQREQLLLVEAELALLDGRPRDAIKRLESMQVRNLTKDLKLTRLGTLAAAQRLANEPVAAAESLSALDRLLQDDQARLLNQVSLVSTLSALSGDELRELARSGSGAMKEWAEIALLARNTGGDPARFERRYRQERGRGLGTRAHPGLAQAYGEMLSGGYASGDRVTVMLPRGGRFAPAGTAVREGIEAARRADTSGHQPVLSVVYSNPAGRSPTVHAEAVRGGADYVLGPLEKEAVDALAAGSALAVPTLALNQTTRDGRAAGNLFQFALSPENEAAEAAIKAADMGHRRALVLYPEGAWGERLARSFRDQWRRLGGTSLVGQAVYDPTARSDERRVADLVGDGDADVLFLVATNDLARRLYPQIRLASSQITVIATSHVYSGAFDPARDPALSGLYFVDIPWMLDSSGDGPLSRRRLTGESFEVANPLARLYAMGIDAYRLAPRLAALAKSPGAFYPGQTGGLAVDSLGRIQRQLALARFGEAGVHEGATTKAATASQ